MSEVNLSGKRILVTGATNGIGEITAFELARMGAEVIVHGRSSMKAEQTMIDIIEATGNDQVDFITGDFSMLEDVEQMAERFNEKYDRLDVLINNAGAYFQKKQVSPDGFEMTFQINHLAPFLLTHRLLEKLRAAPPSRIINLSSDFHVRGKNRLHDPCYMKGRYKGAEAYATSKLYNLYFTYELATYLSGSGITVNAVHPGMVWSGLYSTIKGPLKPFMKWIAHGQKMTVEEAAATSIWAASTPELENVTGEYFADSEISESSKLSHDPEAADTLWDMSIAMTGLQPRVESSE